MNHRQKGFSILEVILIFFVVILIGLVGWMFWNNQLRQTANHDDTSERKTSTSATTQTVKPTTATDQTANWYLYQPSGREYSVKIADGWTLRKKQGGDTSLYSSGELTIKSGEKGQILNSSGAVGVCDSFVLDFLSYAWPDKYRSADATTFKTTSGITVEKTVTADKLGVNGGGIGYGYVTTKNNKTLTMSYHACKDGVDNHDAVEKVVKTVTIN